MFDQITAALSGSSWAYVIVFAVVAGDAVLPLLPGETIVVTGGVLASSGDLNIFLVFLAGAAGAFLGDSACYWIGRKLGTRAAEKFLRGERGKRSLDWAERTLDQRGRTLIAVARFVPGGRTAVSLVAGTTEFPWRTWALADLAGVVVWSAYNTGLGAIGGKTFENQTWKGLLLAFGLAFGTAGVIEAVRWFLQRRKKARMA
ncbi:MAG TPA: DedA family protein [Mycobacteriales bacterium]|nr:DedA family protein [Mycobacteriales bacterium]